MSDKADSWERFCNASDKSVELWNATPQKRCPFCGSKAQMHWNYDGDYDPRFVIECNSCDCRVRSGTFDEAVATWNKRAEYVESKEVNDLRDKLSNVTTAKLFFARRVESAKTELEQLKLDIETLRSCLKNAAEIFEAQLCWRFCTCRSSIVCTVRKWRGLAESEVKK